MKGISTVVATILMLMITIALAGTAYMYISGAFSRTTQGIEVEDYFCVSPGTVNFAISNIGTANITTLASITCTQTSPAGDSCSLLGGTFPLEPGKMTTVTEVCTGTGARTCIYRIVPPGGSAITATVPCA